MYTPRPPATFWESNRILIKGILVAILILVMLIPGVFVSNLVTEREERQEQVVNEVSNKWAGRQTIIGPVLMVPYRVFAKSANSAVTQETKIAYVLPDELHITGGIQPAEKKRSLYRVMLYSSDIQLTGKFGQLPLEALQIPPDAVIWNDIRLVMATGDLKGIQDQVQLNWNGSKQLLDAGIPDNKLLKQGISVPVAIDAHGQATFSINMSLRGSNYLYFSPVGKTTEVDISANWKDPAFDGQYLPVSSDIIDKGFKAHWKILPLSRTYPQYWKDNTQDLAAGAFGVRLIQAVDGYSKTNRSVKYAILFISLTFTFFFFLEILRKRAVHPVQYILVGIALTIFYTLLLSVSEYAGFNIAYLVAAMATVSLIGMYAWSIFKSGKTAIGFTCALSALYTYIFILIQSEDYALLFGSIGLFFIIAIIMYYSRKIDWYANSKNAAPAPAPGADEDNAFTDQ